MKMYTLRVSLIPLDKALFDQGNVARDIKYFEKALIDATELIHQIEHKNKNEARYSLKICTLPDDNNAMSGVVSRANVFHGHNSSFEEYDVDNYPPVVWLWDRLEQVLLVEKKSNVFASAQSACKCFESIANNLALVELGLRVEIKPVLDDKSYDFWREYDNFEFVEKVEFELIPPNLFGETEKSMRDALNDVTEQTNANYVKTVFENVSGKLKLSAEGWVGNAVKLIKKGGGHWKMWGRKNIASSQSSISSVKSAKITFINGQITEAELNDYDSYELAHLLSHYQKEYTYKGYENEDKN